MEVVSHDQIVTKYYLSKRRMVEMIHFLDVDRVQIERSGEGWVVSYIATKSTVTLPKEDSTEVAL